VDDNPKLTGHLAKLAIKAANNIVLATNNKVHPMQKDFYAYNADTGGIRVPN